ncbi:MAG: PAS domain S-box protein, partial [Candidatus Nanopelagicales bacterium]|nr:PAS domain S-box protein [Candidatus Nanopelagicales bacterium]
MTPHQEGPRGLTAAEMLSLEQQVVDNIPDVAVRFSPDATLTWASPSLFYCLGYRPADVIGTRLLMLQDHDGLAETVRETAAQGGDRLGIRCDLVASDGSRVPAEAILRFEYDDAGAHTSTLWVMRIVGQSGEPARLFPLLSDHTTDVVFMFDSRGYTVWVSASTQRVLGFDPVGLIGVNRPLVPDEDRDEVYAWFAQHTRSSATSANRRARVTRADGSWLWMDMSVVFVRSGDGRLDYAVATLRDVHQQVLAEQALRQAEQTFSYLAEYTTDVVYRCRSDGVIEWISPSLTPLLGWAPAEVLGMRASDFVHPDDAGSIVVDASAAPGGRFPTVEVRLRRSDGEYRWVELSRGLIFDAADKVVGRVGGIRDVQEHRDARVALAASEQRFRAAMRDSAVAMCLVAPDGTITTANAAMCEFIDRPPEQTVGLNWQQIVSRHEVSGDGKHVERMTRGEEESFSGIRRYERPDGSTVVADLTVSALRDDSNTLTGFVVQAIDITVREQERLRLAASEAHYRLLADSVSDIVLQCDEYATLTWASRSLTPATGLWPSDVVGRPLIDLLHPNDIEAVQRTFGEVRRGRRCDLEVRLATTSGTHVWFALSIHAPFDDDTAQAGFVATLRDISNEMRVRRLLAEREAEFREIAEHAADVVFRMDPTDKITWISPSIGQVMGYAYRDVLGRDPKIFVHPEDMPTFYTFASGLQPNVPERMTLRAHCADGEYRWFSAIATKIADSRGALVSQIVGLRNIDNEVRAVTALARSEEQFRLAMNSAPSGMAVVDIEGRFLQVNDTLAAITGHGRDWL